MGDRGSLPDDATDPSFTVDLSGPLGSTDPLDATPSRRAALAAEQGRRRRVRGSARPASGTRRIGVRAPLATVAVLTLVVSGLAALTLDRGGSDGVRTALQDPPPSASDTTSALSGPSSSTTGSTTGTTSTTTGTTTGTTTSGRTTTTTGADGRTTTAAGRDGSRTTSGSSTTRRTSSTTRTESQVSTPKLIAGGAPFGTRCSVSAKLVPSCGAYWGIYSRRYGGGNVETTVKTWESKIGRKFDIVLMYYDFSGRNGPGWFPDQSMKNLGSERILLMDWESRNFSTGANLRWADIAAGKYDASVVVPSAQRVKAYGKKVMLGLDHEMDLSYKKHGTAAEYKAAYRHIRSVFAAQGVNNVIWTWVTSGYVGYGNGPLVKSFYPGTEYVDWIGYDPYNFNTCHNSGWETFDQTVKSFYDWSAANGMGDKPLLLQEYGMHYTDNAKARQWYRDIDDVLRKRTRIKALVRWDSDTSCTLRIDSGTGMVEEFAAAGKAIDRP